MDGWSRCFSGEVIYDRDAFGHWLVALEVVENWLVEGIDRGHLCPAPKVPNLGIFKPLLGVQTEFRT